MSEPDARCGGTGMVAYWDGSAYAGEMCRGCVDCEGTDEMTDAIHDCCCVCHSFPDHGKLQDALEALKWHQERLIVAGCRMTQEPMPLCVCGHAWALHVIPGGVENIDIYPTERRCADCSCRNYTSAPVAASTPSAGDLLIAAVDKWASHGMRCDLEECEPCIMLINQLKLAYKVWQSSAHKSATAATE